MDVGLVGGILGGAIGMAGGAIGTYYSIKNTGGPIERAFMIRVSAIAWVVISAFLATRSLGPAVLMRVLSGALVLLTAFGAFGAFAGEAFRCGQWIITDELSVAELKSKCGEPTFKTSEVVEVRGKVGTGSVSRGTSTIEHWTYALASGAHYSVTIVDGELKSIARVK